MGQQHVNRMPLAVTLRKVAETSANGSYWPVVAQDFLLTCPFPACQAQPTLSPADASCLPNLASDYGPAMVQDNLGNFSTTQWPWGGASFSKCLPFLGAVSGLGYSLELSL